MKRILIAAMLLISVSSFAQKSSKNVKLDIDFSGAPDMRLSVYLQNVNTGEFISVSPFMKPIRQTISVSSSDQYVLYFASEYGSREVTMFYGKSELHIYAGDGAQSAQAPGLVTFDKNTRITFE